MVDGCGRGFSVIDVGLLPNYILSKVAAKISPWPVRPRAGRVPRRGMGPLRGLSFWERQLPWALVKIRQVIHKIKPQEEIRGITDALVVRGIAFVC